MKRRRRFLLVLPLCLALAGVCVYLALFGVNSDHRPKFTIGKETSHVTGPVDQDGYIDYGAALNDRLAKGVTPENNAAVLLWQAMGPHPEGARMPDEFFRRLGYRPPEEGRYWVDESAFLKQHRELAPRPTEDESEPAVVSNQLEQCKRRPWRPTEYPWVAAWLKQNEKPLELVSQATRRSAYYSPLTPHRPANRPAGLINSLLPGVQICRGFANALAARALLKLSQGQTDAAWQDLLACHRLGRLVGRRGTLVEALVGMAIEGVASRADLAVLQDVHESGKQVLGRLHDLRSLPPLSTPADNVDLTERFICLETMMMTAHYGIDYLDAVAADGRFPGGSDSVFERGMRFFTNRMMSRIDWDPALRSANEWYDRLVAALRIRDRAERAEELHEIENDLKELHQEVIGQGRPFFIWSKAGAATAGEKMGNILISLFLPALSKIQDAADRTEQSQNNLYLAFALAAYRADHGRYPATLQPLTPKYLSQVPPDLFTGEPLIYRGTEKGYVLYSVGPNGEDDEGRGREDEPKGDDISVRMPLPTQAGNGK